MATSSDAGTQHAGTKDPYSGTKDKAKHLIEEQKDAGAARLSGVAQAIRGAGDQLAHEMPQTARYVRGAATSLDEASASLRERKVDDLLAAVGDFACRQPAVFFGGAVLAGMALSRLLGASNGDASHPHRRR